MFFDIYADYEYFNGNFIMSKYFMFDALRQAIDEEMRDDNSVCVLGEDIGHYGGSYKVTKDLHTKYGDLRVLDTPIAENSHDWS